MKQLIVFVLVLYSYPSSAQLSTDDIWSRNSEEYIIRWQDPLGELHVLDNVVLESDNEFGIWSLLRIIGKKQIVLTSVNRPPCGEIVNRSIDSPIRPFVYPNPTTSEISVNNVERFSDYKLLNIYGTVEGLGSIKGPNLRFNIGNLIDGTYVLMLSNKHEVLALQVIVTNK